MPRNKCAVHTAYEGPQRTTVMPKNACPTCWKIHEEAMNEQLYRMGWRAKLIMEPIPSDEMASGTGIFPKGQGTEQVPAGGEAPPILVPKGPEIAVPTGAEVAAVEGSKVEVPDDPAVMPQQGLEIEPMPVPEIPGEFDETLKAVDDLMAEAFETK